MMLPMMMASLREHVPDSHSGSTHTQRDRDRHTHTHQCYTITVVNNALNSLLFSRQDSINKLVKTYYILCLNMQKSHYLIKYAHSKKKVVERT